ncbi:MAG: 5-formyltetrahydrofolate cyclo-ligase [Thermanaeromonas sp.]|uniref:5-formyltetrahydrofolate cyclo-ligase n=1 Tax=Thermanaeromonas sp. TaxID=2003697 RepID=UPI00243F2EF8|nr:5-formyltetrahydrofolate cyclo-ligase [Thermanaeromonas sp.]MCG0278765.1 5-formyltetrahydrofolate cyclo-ligase [Thermanaeromonas sp.]
MKAYLRKEVLARRNALSEGERNKKNKAIHRRLLSLSAWEEANFLMIYVSFGSEVSTDYLIKKALAQGKKVAVPYCLREERKLMASVIYDYPGDLIPRTWGILEPRPEALRPVEPGLIDLCLVPGVAFDIYGNRLGYGAGYYDRFLPRLRPDAYKIALAFEVQIVDTVFPTPQDVPVDLIITEARMIRP